MTFRELIGPQLDRLQNYAKFAAIAGAVLGLAGLAVTFQLQDVRQWFAGYLVAYMFVLGITCGSLAWLMIGHVTGGGWAMILRRPLEAGVRNLPWVFVMFMPILAAVWMGASNNQPFYMWSNTATWTNPGHSEPLDPHIRHLIALKSPWLNPLGFTIRALIYFVIWGYLGHILIKWSRAQDTSNDPELHRKLNTRSAVGLLVFALSMTFASIDWVMSLLPTWYSSLFGAIFVVGQGLSTLALMTVLINGLARNTRVVQNIEPRYFRDLGNLHLAFTLLWGYTNFSQFMLQWSANMPEEVEWYHFRISWDNGWIWVGVLLGLGHFWIPFFCLLSSSLKVKVQNLSKLSLWILLMRLIDLTFYITPQFRQDHFTFKYILSDVGLPMLLIGLWLVRWVAELRPEYLVPIADPRVEAQMPAVRRVLDTSTVTVPAGGVVSHA